MFKMTDEEVEQSFELVYKAAFKDMLDNHVRPERHETFLVELYRNTNENGGSTLWGVVKDLLVERFNYTEEDFRALNKYFNEEPY